jgi:hypothetical protein
VEETKNRIEERKRYMERHGMGGTRDTYLDDFTHTATGFFENGLHAFTGCLCLVGDAAFDEVSILVGGDLARDEDVAAYLDCLALFRIVLVTSLVIARLIVDWVL